MKELVVSHSKLNTWRKCHRAYYYKYVDKLIKKVKSGALQRGSIIHECIEAYNSGKSWKKVFKRFEKDFYENTFEEERVILGDIPKMVESLMENYVAAYEDDDLEYLANEQEFLLPLGKFPEGKIYITGYIDALVKDTKGCWVLERKTYSRSPDLDFLVFNSQSGIYSWACEQLNFPIKGTLWEIIKASEPSGPRILKSGEVSQAKIDSTPYTIEKWLRENGFDPKEYTPLINSCSFEDYFTRRGVLVNKPVVKSLMSDVITTSREILSYGDNIPQDRNLTRNCAFCDYKEICQAELMDLDSDYIKKKSYVRKEEGNDQEKDPPEKRITKKLQF